MSDQPQPAAATRETLFQRELPESYREEMGALVAEIPVAVQRAIGSLLLFRIGGQRFAVPTSIAAGITPMLHIARLPHRSGTVLIGLAAFRGQILPCCSLERLFDLDASTSPATRMLVLEEAPGRRWMLPVEAALGVRMPDPNTATDLASPIDASWIRTAFHDDAGPFFELDPETLFRQINLATA